MQFTTIIILHEVIYKCSVLVELFPSFLTDPVNIKTGVEDVS